jgi:creatinine amidohydrolase
MPLKGAISASMFLLLALASSSSAQILRVAELSTTQIKDLDRKKTVVLLPGGILEGHGPFLPSFIDGYLNERLTAEIANAIVARPGWTVLVFPTLPLGSDPANSIGEKDSFDGSYAVRPATLRAVYLDLATELGEAGFRWIFIINIHGSPIHNTVMNQAVDYFHDVYGGHMVNLLGLKPVGQAMAEYGPKLLTKEQQQENGFFPHADSVETSLGLFLKPGLIRADFKDAPPKTVRNFSDVSNVAHMESWPGYFGSPRLATASLGAQVFENLSRLSKDLVLRILDGFDSRSIRQHPYGSGEVTRKDKRIEKQQADWLKKQGLE